VGFLAGTQEWEAAVVAEMGLMMLRKPLQSCRMQVHHTGGYLEIPFQPQCHVLLPL
jgi:hypothetical protein